VGLHSAIRRGFYTSAGQEGVSKKMESGKGAKGAGGSFSGACQVGVDNPKLVTYKYIDE
jgi:hypothetical protein